MTSPRTKFYRDKQQGKWAGVCAGIADYTGVDVTIIRIGFVISAVISGGSTIAAYFIIAWMSPKKPRELYDRDPDQKKFWQGVRANPRRTARDVRSRFRDLDRRLADVEAYVTSSNHRLATEIERLR
jgi:phage shock protein C